MSNNNLDENQINENQINENQINENQINENELNKNELNKNELNENELNENQINENQINENELNENELNDNELNDNELNDNELNQQIELNDKKNLNNIFINKLEQELLLIDDTMNNDNTGILIINKLNLYNKTKSSSDNNITPSIPSKYYSDLTYNKIIIYIIIFWILNHNKIINMINIKYSTSINLLIRTSIFGIIIYFIKFFSHYII
jgi:hypothetical protein